MCSYSSDLSDFAYPWKAFCALWSNIWRADKNPSVASKQLWGLTLSKRGFYFPQRFDLLCIFYWAVLIPQRCTKPISCRKCISKLINTKRACLEHVASHLRDICESVQGPSPSPKKIIVFDIQQAFHLLFFSATPHERNREVNELSSQVLRQYV